MKRTSTLFALGLGAGMLGAAAPGGPAHAASNPFQGGQCTWGAYEAQPQARACVDAKGSGRNGGTWVSFLTDPGISPACNWQPSSTCVPGGIAATFREGTGATGHVVAAVLACSDDGRRMQVRHTNWSNPLAWSTEWIDTWGFEFATPPGASPDPAPMSDGLARVDWERIPGWPEIHDPAHPTQISIHVGEGGREWIGYVNEWGIPKVGRRNGPGSYSLADAQDRFFSLPTIRTDRRGDLFRFGAESKKVGVLEVDRQDPRRLSLATRLAWAPIADLEFERVLYHVRAISGVNAVSTHEGVPVVAFNEQNGDSYLAWADDADAPIFRRVQRIDSACDTPFAPALAWDRFQQKGVIALRCTTGELVLSTFRDSPPTSWVRVREQRRTGMPPDLSFAARSRKIWLAITSPTDGASNNSMRLTSFRSSDLDVRSWLRVEGATTRPWTLFESAQGEICGVHRGLDGRTDYRSCFDF